MLDEFSVPLFEIALYEPEIAPNTGNIIRLCANCGAKLHLIEPLGFQLEEKKLRRAGLDYRDLTHVTIHPDFSAFLESTSNRRLFACTTKTTHYYNEVQFQEGDILLFGPETRGLPLSIIESLPLAQRLKIPMQSNSRSLNLSNAVAILAYSVWQQLGFKGMV